MKIYDTTGIMLPQKNGQSAGNVKSKGEFQKMMSDVMSQQDQTSSPVPSGNPNLFTQNSATVQNIPTAGGIESCKSEPKEVRELQGLLDLADIYAQKLSDTSIATKALQPLVTHLEEGLDGLSQLEQKGGLDTGLKKIISELNVTLGTEIAKFKRGDYA